VKGEGRQAFQVGEQWQSIEKEANVRLFLSVLFALLTKVQRSGQRQSTHTVSQSVYVRNGMPTTAS
jgi:hypothetical protein